MEKKFQFFRKLLLLTLLMLGVGSAFGAWDGTSMTEPSTEKIDGKDYYIIDSEAKLAWFANESNRLHTSAFDKNAKLTADLDMGSHLWVPICAGTGGKAKDGITYCQYKGSFDGDSHVIKNMYINGTELAAINIYYTQNLGFVGVLGGGSIKNLVLEMVDIHATTNAGEVVANVNSQISVGAFVGWMAEVDNNVVDNCMVTGSIKTTGKGQGVGGIVGNAKKGTITNCMSLVEIQTSGSQAYIGGIIGITKTDVAVTSCVYAGPGLTNTGTNGAVGGITGNVYSGSMTAEDSYYEGTNYYQGNEVGGVGRACDTCHVTSTTVLKVDESNEDEVACTLNGGTYTNNACDKTGPWSIGETGLSLDGYGIDGYKITFDANGGEFPENAKTTKFLQSGQVITADEITNPRRDGKAFAGWALTSNAQEPVADFGTANKAMTIYAVWNPVYTITFNAAPGAFPNNAPEKIIQVAKGEKITVEGMELPFTYTDKNNVKFYFTGWALTQEAPEEDTLHVLPTATENLTLFAVWTQAITYTVTYNDNGHGKTKVDFVRVEKREKTNPPEDPEPDEGYTFGGWYTEKNCQSLFNFETTEITENKILYAKWTPIPYRIMYVLDGGTNDNENPNSYNIESETIVLKAPTKEGYDFKGWFYDNGFTQKATQITQGTTGDKTVHAKWSKKTYKITYTADNNSYGSVSDQYKEHDVAINLESAGYFRRNGYDQSGWATKANGAKVYDFGAEYSVNAPLALYPSWSLATYTITYECDGCTHSNQTTYTYNTNTFSVTYPNSREGYSFGGWFKETSYTTKVEQIYKNSYGNLTLYGKWLVAYTITYVGTDNPYGDKTYTSEKAAQLRTCAPRDGYTFAGWYDNAEFTGEPVTEVPLGSTGDKTFYAKWVKNNNGAITFTKQSDGTFSAVINGNYGGDDTPNSDEADAVVITSDVTVSSVTLNRSFNVNRISTLYVPFEIDAANVSNATVYKFKNVVWNENEKRWKFKVAQTTKVLANTPYVVLPSASQVTFDFSGTVTFNTTTPGEHAVSKDGYWEFKGLYEYTKFIMDNKNPIFVFANQERSGAKLGEFVRTTQGAYSNPMRAYLVYHQDNSLSKSARGSLGGRILLPDELDIVVEDENGIVVETGLLNTVTGEVKMDRWFDLKGRMLNSKPSAKGTYYKNGKKVIIK